MKIVIIGTKEFQQCDLYPKGSIHEVEWRSSSDTGRSYLSDVKRGGMIDTRLIYETAKEDQIHQSKKCRCGCNLEFEKDAIFIPSPEDGKVKIALRCFERKYIPYRTEYRQAIREEIINEIKSKLNE